MEAKAGMLSHHPPSTWACYTENAAAAAAQSNLQLGTKSGADAIDQFILDPGVPDLGHRRWLLYGPLGPVGVGYSIAESGLGGSCVAVSRHGGSAGPEWVAYPNPGYAPVATASGAWSFHSDRWASLPIHVQVTRTRDGMALPVAVSQLPSGYGANAVSFTPMGWTPAAGETYRVSIFALEPVGGTPDVTYDVSLVSC
jgi:hypothetical protein